MLSSTLTDPVVVFELTVDGIRRWICIGGCSRLGGKRERRLKNSARKKFIMSFFFPPELNILDQEIQYNLNSY